MIFPYRIRRLLKRLFVSVLVLILAAAALLLCWVLWLDRYVVYTRDGVKLDLSLSPLSPDGQTGTRPETVPVDIYYNEGENTIQEESTELTQLAGYYASGQMLSDDFAAVEAEIRKLPTGTPVMLDVKNIRGSFYYTSAIGTSATSVAASDMDRLITYLRQNNFYLIARLPAFRDYQYGLEHVDFGIFNPNRLSLWMDEDKCYWLHPGSEGTLTYLVQIVTELKGLGFDEVVFDDFRFPDTNSIYVEGDRNQILAQTAESLVKICATDTFAVSFSVRDASFALPQGRTRLYLSGVAAADAAGFAQQTGLEDASVRLVFLTELLDTRFENYGVLRPVGTTR